MPETPDATLGMETAGRPCILGRTPTELLGACPGICRSLPSKVFKHDTSHTNTNDNHNHALIKFRDKCEGIELIEEGIYVKITRTVRQARARPSGTGRRRRRSTTSRTASSWPRTEGLMCSNVT